MSNMSNNNNNESGIKSLDTLLDIKFSKKYGKDAIRPIIKNKKSIDFYINSFFDAISSKIETYRSKSDSLYLGICSLEIREGHSSDSICNITPLITIKIKTKTDEFKSKIDRVDSNIIPLLLELGLDEKTHTWFLWTHRVMTENIFLLCVYNL